MDYFENMLQKDFCFSLVDCVNTLQNVSHLLHQLHCISSFTPKSKHFLTYIIRSLVKHLHAHLWLQQYIPPMMYCNSLLEFIFIKTLFFCFRWTKVLKLASKAELPFSDEDSTSTKSQKTCSTSSLQSNSDWCEEKSEF